MIDPLITAADVNKLVRLRNGEVRKIKCCDAIGNWPIDLGGNLTVTPEGYFFDSDDEDGSDVVAWADESPTPPPTKGRDPDLVRLTAAILSFSTGAQAEDVGRLAARVARAALAEIDEKQ